MESANLQTLSRLGDLFNSRDIDGYLRTLDPVVEWRVAREDPETTVHHGREQVRGYLQRWIDAFADLRLDIEEAHTVSDRVLTVLRMQGHGSGSSVPFDQRVSFIFSLRDGQVTKVEEFFDHDEARRAAGVDQASTK